MPFVISLLIVVLLQVVVAFFGHNLVHVWERYAFLPLVVIFAIAGAIVFSKANLGLPADPKGLGNGTGLILTAAAAYGYACGWNPYASDYSRYLPVDTSQAKTGWSAGLGLFISCVALELVAALATVHAGDQLQRQPDPAVLESAAGRDRGADPARDNAGRHLGQRAQHLQRVDRVPHTRHPAGRPAAAGDRRARVRRDRLLRGAGRGLSDLANTYNSFLLVLAYWIGPWFGIVFTDYVLRRGDFGDGAIFYDRKHNPWSGVVAFLVATIVSIALFSNETAFVGVFPAHWPGIGDLTFVVGFVLAVVIYGGLNLRLRRKAQEGSAAARSAS